MRTLFPKLRSWNFLAAYSSVKSHSQIWPYFFSYLPTCEVNFRNFRNYGSNGAIYYFLKPETNKDDFRLYFELLEKSYRGRHHSEISNSNTMISSLWMRPWGPPEFQNIRKNLFNNILMVWSANIEPKLRNIWETVRKHGFLMIFFSILTVFRSFLNSGAILTQELNSFICKKEIWFCDTPGTPWGATI